MVRAMGMGTGQLGAFALVFSSLALASPCVGPAACREVKPIGAASFPLYSTHSLSGRHPEVERAVVVVHGVLRNADEYFSDVAKSAALAGVADKTVVLAPHFQSNEDKVPAGLLYWDESTWKRGDDSLVGGDVSAFKVMDLIVEALADRARFPNVREIVLTGHSAGGQFMSRYVATSRAEDSLGSIAFHYVVSNPSTYFYTNDQRALAGTLDKFGPVPAGCPDYDDYPYGVQKRNAYASQVTVSEMEHFLATRRLSLLLGDSDNQTDYLDMSCGANLQGAYRFVRGLTYANFLEVFLRPAQFRVAIVKGVGHSGRDMYQSPVGQAVLFQ